MYVEIEYCTILFVSCAVYFEVSFGVLFIINYYLFYYYYLYTYKDRCCFHKQHLLFYKKKYPNVILFVLLVLL